jgi:heme O synthase-like polyprenyltransferase
LEISPVQPVANRPIVDAAANLRRSVVVAACLGTASLVVLALFGHPFMGMFVCIGLSLGALNNKMLQQSMLNYAVTPTMTKGRFARRALVRLSIVTAIALVFGLIFRPDGLGLFAGLAVFQVLMLVGASVPVFRSLRHP